MTSLVVGLVQLDSQLDKEANLEKALRLIREACDKGAQFIALPEVFNVRRAPNLHTYAEPIDGHSIGLLRQLAQEKGVCILAGSFCEAPSKHEVDAFSEQHVYNTSVLVDQEGDIKAVYRKIHLFESDLDNCELSESQTYLSGNDTVMTDVFDIPTGLSICYDLRFPELYREYTTNGGAEMLTVPSSFTKVTGEAHWEVLLRARAIENLAFVVAPNQVGIGANDVPTFGNSMIVDPWGKIIAHASPDQEETVVATLDFKQLRDYRESFPALAHMRL